MSTAKIFGLNDALTARPPFITSEEATLMVAARAGDSAAFEHLVMPHWDALLRVTQRILRNREDAEDAVQIAFLDAFRNLSGFRGRSRFSSWLTRIAMNAALMQLRVTRRKRETSLDELTEVGETRARFHLVEKRLNPEQEYLSKEGRILLAAGLKKLGPLYVEVLHLSNVQELSATETARRLELPLGTVKARLHRARTKLVWQVQSMLRAGSVTEVSGTDVSERSRRGRHFKRKTLAAGSEQTEFPLHKSSPCRRSAYVAKESPREMIN